MGQERLLTQFELPPEMMLNKHDGLLQLNKEYEHMKRIHFHQLLEVYDQFL